MSRPTRCPDCDTAFEPSEAIELLHCPACGQEFDVGPLRWRDVVADFVGTLVTFEFPILRTARDLPRGPGRVAAAWVAGRRRSYVSPIKFLVIVGVIVALVYEPLRDLRARLHRNEAIYETGLAHYAPQYAAFFCLALLLPIAWLMRGFGKLAGLRPSWSEWYALALFCYGFGILLQLGFQLTSLAVSIGRWFRVAELSVPIVMLAWGAYGFVSRESRWRALGVALLAQVLVIAAAGAANQWIG